MAAKAKSGLGRGLDSVFVDNTLTQSAVSPTVLPISDIQPRKDQPRSDFNFELLQQLADSIAANGMIQPIAVRESIGGYYEIIAGERRWRAAKMAGLSEVPVTILSADSRKAAELSIIENVQREDLNPIEEARAYKKLMDEYDLTQEKAASAVGKSRSAVANLLRLLDLPEKTQTLVSSGELSLGHAKVLLGCVYEEDLDKAARIVVEKQLSVRQTETLVKQLNDAAEREEQVEEDLPQAPVKIDYRRRMVDNAAKQLGRRLTLGGRGKTKRLELFYEDDDDLESILRALCGDKLFDDDLT